MRNGLIINKHGDWARYLNDELHNESGHAAEFASGTKFWYINGVAHRINGPAEEWADGSNFWYINGIALTEEEHAAAVAEMQLN